MKKRTVITRIGTFLLAGALMVGGASASSTAYAENGADIKVVEASMPEFMSQPGQGSVTVSSGDADIGASLYKSEDDSDTGTAGTETGDEKSDAVSAETEASGTETEIGDMQDKADSADGTVENAGETSKGTADDGISADGEAGNKAVSDTVSGENPGNADHDCVSGEATDRVNADGASGEVSQTDASDNSLTDTKVSEVSGDVTDPITDDDNTNEADFDDGWNEVDESDLPPDESVIDTIDLHIEEIEELSEDSVLDPIIESKVVLPERVLMANADAKSTDRVVGDLIDLTDIYTGEAASHDCENYLRENHDGDHHWRECAVCGKEYDIEHHEFTTMGNDSCVWSNSGETRYCEECGYMTVYKRTHVDDTSRWYTRPDQKWHYRKCNYCNSYGSVTEVCVDSKGNPIKCDGGTCAVCGYTYGPGHTYYNSAGGDKGTIHCSKCGIMMISFDSNTGFWSGDNTYKASIRITDWNKEIYGEDAQVLADTITVGGTGGGTSGEVSELKTSVKNGYIYASCMVTFPYEERGGTWANEVWHLQPYSTRIPLACHGGPIETRAPEIKSANISYASKNGEYSTKATLTVTCTDNWVYEPNYVQVRLVDDKKEPASDWVTCAKSGTTFSQTLDLVTEASGSKTFYVQAQDAGGNVSEKQVTLANLDSRAPVVTSALTTTEDWSKMKTITFTCTDEGVGDVQIAFNNQSDYQKADFDGTTYSRSYTFTGDVYGSARAAVYFKDGAGNVTTEFVEIYNLDNTEPVISMTDVSDAFNASGEAYGWNVKAGGSDDNAKLSKTGSGIAGYALTRDDAEPEDSSYQADQNLFLGRSGKYYLWIKDGAGNVTRSDDRIVIHSDYYFNGKEVNSLTYNGKEVTSFYYNGKRIRL